MTEQGNGEDFSQDVKTGEEQQLIGADGNAAGEKQNGENGNGEALTRDDDR